MRESRGVWKMSGNSGSPREAGAASDEVAAAPDEVAAASEEGASHGGRHTTGGSTVLTDEDLPISTTATAEGAARTDTAQDVPTIRTPLRWVPDTWSLPNPQRFAAVAGVVAVGLSFLLVLVAYGVLPGHLPDPIDFYSGSGVATCVAHNFPDNLFSCPSIGYPTSYRAPFGQPVLWVSGFLQWLGVDPVNGTRLTWMLCLLVGFWGGRRLFARVTSVGWLAWAGVLAYLLAPIASNQGGYGALQLGFVLVPAYLLVDVRLAEALTARARRAASGVTGSGSFLARNRSLVLRWVALLAVRTVGLMMDPYSFFIATTGVLALWLVYALRNFRLRQILPVVIAAAAVLSSFVFAYLVYSRSVDTSGFSTEPLDYFRGAGVDLYALVVPSNLVWWAELTGFHHNIGPLQAYNDGHNLNDVYLGVLLLGLAVMGLIVGGRRNAGSLVGAGVRVVAGLAGAAAFLLALGPSIRIEDFRIISPSAKVTYSMPASAATIASPWSWVYQHIPGISDMRAVWRWELGARLGAVVLAILALGWWVGRTKSWRTRWIPAVLAVLIVVESVGNIPFTLQNQQNYLGDARAVETLVTDPLTSLVKPGERAILYGPADVSPGSNDYMANFLCAATALRCYNVGGDKALGIAVARMPKTAREVILSHGKLGDQGVEQRMRALFAADQLDVVVLINFDLSAQAGNWPPTGTARATGEAAGKKMFAGNGFTRVDTPFFTVIHPSS